MHHSSIKCIDNINIYLVYQFQFELMFCFKPTEANVDFDMIRFGQVLIMIHDLHTERAVSSWAETFSVAPSFLNPES